MSGLYGFRCSTPESPLAASTLVIFCGPNLFAETDLQAVVQRETRTGAAPEHVYLIVPNWQAETALSLDRRNTAWDPLSDRGTQIRVIAYDGHGTLEFRTQEAAPAPVPEDLAIAIRRQGLTRLFRDRGAMLDAGPTAHFVKPSGKPARRFMRAAQALSEGPEIYFSALWMLPWLAADVSIVHVDTSSISHLVFAALLMKDRSGEGELTQIMTFRSYEGIRTHSFSRDRRELCVVSASESGTMASLLGEKVQHRSDVLTLFSTANAPNDTTVLCDLRFDEELNPLGFQSSPRETPLHASRPVRLIGEHFVVEARPASAVVPLKTDAPDCVARLAELKGGGVFSMLQSNPPDDAKAPWVDVSSLLTTSAGKKWLREKACAAIPITTRALLLADDHPATRELADALTEEVTSQTGLAPGWAQLTASEIEAGCGIWTKKNPTAPVVVIAGATGHGRELLSASRALRDYAPDSVRTFLTTVVSGANADAIDMLKRNLEFGGHRFVRMFDLPIDRRRSAGSWRREIEFLEVFDDELPATLRDRLMDLKKTSVGLRNNLFLDAEAGPLALRQNFAFWKGGDAAGADQADVFVTIASILENLRTGVDPSSPQRLFNDANTQSVLSPEIFSRFNDGIIQSSLLRAALPVELNYASSRDQSRAIADLILQMCELHDRPQGEALSEFLMALRSGRIVLEDVQRQRLEVDLSARAGNLPTLIAWLIKNTGRDNRGY